MKKEDSNIKKLSQIGDREGIVPFLLAIIRGADINEKRKGTPIVEDYFRYLKDGGGDFWGSNAQYQTALKKFKTLVTLGADTGTIIYNENTPYASPYQSLLYEIVSKLGELSLILGSDSLRAEIKGYRLWLLKYLGQLLDEADRAITDAHLHDTPGEGTAKPFQVLGMGYDAILMGLTSRLVLLSVLLQSDSGKRELSGWRREMLEALQESLRDAGQMIADTGMVDRLGEPPDPYELKEVYEQAIRKESLPAHEFDEKELAWMKKINEILGLELDLGDIDNENDGGQR